MLDELLVNLESLGKNGIVDSGVGSEDGVSDGNHPGILAAECGQSYCRLPTDVELEMDETLGEDEDVSRVESLGEQLGRVGGDEADEELTLEDGEHLGRPRVRVWRVQPLWSEVNAGERDAQSVKADEVVHVDGGDLRSQRVVGVSGVVQAGEEEVLSLHVRGVLTDNAINEHYMKSAPCEFFGSRAKRRSGAALTVCLVVGYAKVLKLAGIGGK